VADKYSKCYSSLSEESVLSPFIRFWNNLTALQAAAVVAALVLTIGVIVEYWYKLKLLAFLLLKWILRKATPFDRCVFKRLLLHSTGPILVVLGIAGEVVFEGRTFVVEDRQEEQARKIVGSLSEKAGQAETKAQSAFDKSSLAETKADTAGTAAGKAQQKEGDVARQADELNRELLATKTQLATVEAKRAELEKSLVNLAICNAPRVIPLWSINTPGNAVTKTAVDALKPHAGWQFVIEYVPLDAEARRAAANVAGALEGAGWKMAKASQMDGIDDGVEVRAYFNRKAEPQEWGLHVNSQEAADTLVDFLHSYNWEVKSGWASDTDTDIPPNGIKIRVGLYPAVSYVSPPGAKDLAAAIAQFEQERQKMTKQMEEKELEREEEMLKHLTPQQAAEHKARMEQRKEERKLWTERYSGPCEPLTPLSPIVR
jgi:hypothetical protein